MKNWWFIIVFVIISLLIAGIVYFSDKSFNIIINGNTFYHYDKKFTLVKNPKTIKNKEFEGYVNNEKYDNIKIENKDNSIYLTSSYDLDYTNSFLYNKSKTNIDLLELKKLDFNDSDYELLNRVLNIYNLNNSDTIGDEHKYEIDLNSDGLYEYLCFSTNNSMYDIPSNPYSLVYIDNGNDYTVLYYNNQNKFDGRTGSLNKIFSIDNNIFFIIELVGYSESNKCNILYSFSNKLNELLNDC